ncbi:helix-turn-helix transcriptional regulator [uncultured Ilyobacter sp.]|uniref:helix-turn-helix domain-containing protein n=1 Tax=uncultured Ilyobacter sp. TaxID=544433 RepID=UPI0029F50906|nr:helix-turn-helix transcriptional regulator [uncultured Ilyobacter sp.]
MEKGELVKKYRLKNKLTQKELGNLIGISSKYVSNIETLRKPAPKKMVDFLVNNFNISKKDTEILKLDKKQNKNYNLTNTNKEKSLSKREIELNKKEKEILATYDFIRENHFILSKVAHINRLLIELNNSMEKYISEIELSLFETDEELIKKASPAIKTTLKRINEKKNRLESLIAKSKTIEI